ncbi:unnamed protein product [Microthlaspi erraticum]|uniref:Uncharacterized protein n=1 Tax=Microthlaspi erraticum TaxID=1685480 RepID=A0A6D2I3N4_9BRAS|nr:unnamed protein product [Microthlaspi erraticum]
MAGTDVSERPNCKLILVVDKEKNKVVWAEAGKDFVHVVRSFMALPMGTIVRLLEKYEPNQKSQIGCYNNLYKSVSDLPVDDFMREACKGMLLYPEKQCRQLHLNIDDDTECDEIFDLNIDGDKRSVIITENMKVEFASIAVVLDTLHGLGYENLDKLENICVDVGHKEVLSLLLCLFSSETPLTDVFLNKHSSCGMMTRLPDMPTLTSMQGRGEAEPNEVVSLTVFVRKRDMKVMCAESGHEFVDLLCIFLAVPLESVWELLTPSSVQLGCLGNFCTSMKSLFSTGDVVSTCMLPLEYSFQKSLLGDSYEMNNFSDLDYGSYDDGSSDSEEKPHDFSGFVKRLADYMILDDLTIKAANSYSPTAFLMELDVGFKEIKPHEINISKTQVCH